MRVLVACEESQTVTKAFRELGHEAYSCDLVPCSGGHPEWHIIGDAAEIIEGGWDLIIAHPPCTYLSNAGNAFLFCGTERVKHKGHVFRLMNEERIRKGIQARDFFLRMLNAPCGRVAVENPKPNSLWQLPKPSQKIEPYMFGDPWRKKTYLWLKGLPPLIMTEAPIQPEGLWAGSTSAVKDPKVKERWKLPTNRDPRRRSKTFPGIARAMAEQWGGKV